MNEYDQFVNIEKYEPSRQYIMINYQFILINDMKMDDDDEQKEQNKTIYQQKRDNEIDEWTKAQLMPVEDDICIKTPKIIGYFNEIIKFVYNICHLI